MRPRSSNRPRDAILWRLALLALVAAIAGCGPSAPRGPCSLDGDIGTICGFENPEDVEYVSGADLLIASNARWDSRDGGTTGGHLSGFRHNYYRSS